MYMNLALLFGSYLVHVTGLQTHADMWLWVRWVWVWVMFEVPIPNPHPWHRFCRFFKGTIILITATVQFRPHISEDIFISQD